jgi:CTP:phosphocholine cytidylyltransferase-like protein
MCLYKKNDQTYFKLKCECGLRDNKGYCPLPAPEALLKKNDYLRRMWIGDNCHSLDRHIFKAQLECGIGTNFGTLANATENSFIVNYYPYI